MNPLVTGLGLATPPAAARQSQAARLAMDITLTDPSQRTLVEGLYRRAGVQSRASAILASTQEPELPLDQAFFPNATPGKQGTQNWPSTGERMSAFGQYAGPLAHLAATRAMQDAAVSPADITHLITVSCTGLCAPGFDVELMQSLGLQSSVERLNLGFMGCHGGIVALRTAASLVRGACVSGGSAPAPPPCVLAVCVELCSLHLQRTDRADQHVANALFADGAAAAVIQGCAAALNRLREPRGVLNPTIFELRSASSHLFHDTLNAMSWRIGDHGFEMTLDRSVPSLLETHLGGWVWPWLRSELGADIRASDLRWAVHPGGPRVLDAVERGLALESGSLPESRAVLSDQGNMSSATVLFILDRVRRAARANTEHSDLRPTVLLAFGPGLTGEAALLVSHANTPTAAQSCPCPSPSRGV